MGVVQHLRRAGTLELKQAERTECGRRRYVGGWSIDEFGHAGKRGVQRLGQDRQQYVASIALEHRRLVCEVGFLVGGMDAQDVALRLKGAPQLLGPNRWRTGDDHRLDGWIGQHLLDVGDHARRTQLAQLGFLQLGGAGR